MWVCLIRMCGVGSLLIMPSGSSLSLWTLPLPQGWQPGGSWPSAVGSVWLWGLQMLILWAAKARCGAPEAKSGSEREARKTGMHPTAFPRRSSACLNCVSFRYIVSKNHTLREIIEIDYQLECCFPPPRHDQLAHFCTMSTVPQWNSCLRVSWFMLACLLRV